MKNLIFINILLLMLIFCFIEIAANILDLIILLK